MKFQYIVLAFFGFMAVVAVFIFAKAPAPGNTPQQIAGASGTVTIWGTYPLVGGLDKVIGDFDQVYQKSFQVNYQYHDPKDFDRDIVEGLASGKGPDILLLPNNLILRHGDKIEQIPYTAYPQVNYDATFVQAAEIYKRDQGLVALPFALDPLVMYWNRDLFTNESIAEPPKYWDEFLTMTPKLTKINPRTSEITQSTISFGEFVNVNNAKDILAMLFLQVGNPIVKFDKGLFTSALVEKTGDRTSTNEDIVSAFRFFMDFSNPQKSIYSWSRARGSSQDEFINGNLAVYFGHASEYKTLAAKNPHLNFAVAPVPQPRNTKVEVTYADVYGLAVMKSSKNKQTAFVAVQRLLDTQPTAQFAQTFNLPPVRRDLLVQRPTDTALSVFYDAALRARTWLDPRPEDSDKAFQSTVESVSSGRNTIAAAIESLHIQLLSALAPYRQ